MEHGLMYCHFERCSAVGKMNLLRCRHDIYEEIDELYQC